MPFVPQGRATRRPEIAPASGHVYSRRCPSLTPLEVALFDFFPLRSRWPPPLGRVDPTDRGGEREVQRFQQGLCY